MDASGTLHYDLRVLDIISIQSAFYASPTGGGDSTGRTYRNHESIPIPNEGGPQVCSSNMYQNKEKNMNLNYDASTFMF